MSIPLIRAALEKHLNALGTFATAWENGSFTPAAGQPYQRVNLLRARPDNQVHGARVFFDLGTLQIRCLYELGAGPGPAETRAEQLRAHFKRGTSVSQGGVTVLVTGTPTVSSGYEDGDRWCVPVSIPWQAQITAS